MNRLLPALLLIPLLACAPQQQPETRPNIVLIMTDDQGYGDVGFHGNTQIQTPALDRLSKESVELTQFYVSPVCAPTRASLMTGRHHYRTGVVDTYLGRAMMYSEETTIAEILRDSSYRTGIFGKWHLGDNYPLRAMDQGFQESLVHRGGGIGQPSDPPGNRYFDPLLLRNGREVQSEGYCTDIFFKEALEFIGENRESPFFAYIATNAPHTPLQIGEEYVAPYLEKGLDETTSKVYGMITNIDENVERLLNRLEELDLSEKTILIFMTDNGHQQERFSAGLRGRKASVYEGGIRVPFLIRWPGVLPPGVQVDAPAAHIDLLPTLLDAAAVPLPEGLRVDGVSLLPLLKDPATPPVERLLFVQTHRGEVPEFGRNCAVRDRSLKLVQPEGWQPGPLPEDPPWKLYDIVRDPGEQEDLAGSLPREAARLKAAYTEWFEDVSATRGYAPPRIVLGSEFENPVILTRQDWRGPKASWSPEGLGYWEVDVIESAPYRITFRFPATEGRGSALLNFQEIRLEKPLQTGESSVSFESVQLPRGPGRLEAILEFDEASIGVHYVEVLK